MRSLCALTGSAILLALTACSAGTTPSSEESQLPQVDIAPYLGAKAELIEAESRFVFPIDRYMMSIEDLDKIDRVTTLQMRTCMADKGHTYFSHDVPPSVYLAKDDRRYGIWNLTDAAQYGYGMPTEWIEIQTEMEAAGKAAYADADEAVDQAHAECMEWLSHERLPWIGRGSWLSEDDDRALFLPTDLDYQAYLLAQEDKRYGEAFDEWATCLVENGLTPSEEPGALGPADVPEELEAQIRVAVIDVTCKQKTRLIERVSSVEAQYQAALIAENQAALNASLEKQTEILQKADEIIATHG
ncbi:hypothetical protein [Microbacterium sp. No. 7]|uniref:hypothetical protein n=1 Tax=Microbacterium sp. No. 7 TaxID=1714373 RepID=UPI0006D237EE|nr:hypothetical protein [Microbacterium sp. No. 7]ALJ19412.1 hypothetical protein AOA12_05625 [Microbacterium sp. No. 7]